MEKVIGLEFNFANNATSSILLSKESLESLGTSILAGKPIRTYDFGISETLTANGTVFSGTLVPNLSDLISNSTGITMESHVYEEETANLNVARIGAIQIGFTSGKLFTDSIENYCNSETVKTIPYVGNINDFYPTYLSKLREEPFIVFSAYEELFNAFILKIKRVIFLLDRELQNILEKEGLISLETHIFSKMKKYYKDNRYAYY